MASNICSKKDGPENIDSKIFQKFSNTQKGSSSKTEKKTDKSSKEKWHLIKIADFFDTMAEYEDHVTHWHIEETQECTIYTWSSARLYTVEPISPSSS